MKTNKSMRDCAFDEITTAKHPLSFVELYGIVALDLEMTEDEKKRLIGHFYTDLTLDGRFVALTDNTWDLRTRHAYEKVHIDVNDVYTDVEESDVDEETRKEEQEFLSSIEGKPVDDGAPIYNEEEDGEEKAGGDNLDFLGINE